MSEPMSSSAPSWPPLGGSTSGNDDNH
jgi:hypothetical protein